MTDNDSLGRHPISAETSPGDAPDDKTVHSPLSPRLTVIKGARQGTEFPLTTSRITIGRSKQGNDLVLNDPQASRNHAVILREDAVFLIVDLQSTNGTIVNGQAITGWTLSDGDMIEIGDTVLVFNDQVVEKT